MVNQGPFGAGLEVDIGLAKQAEPLLFKIPPQTIQEGSNTQEDRQDQKNPPLCHIFFKYHNSPWSTKCKLSGELISKPS